MLVRGSGEDEDNCISLAIRISEGSQRRGRDSNRPHLSSVEEKREKKPRFPGLWMAKSELKTGWGKERKSGGVREKKSLL